MPRATRAAVAGCVLAAVVAAATSSTVAAAGPAPASGAAEVDLVLSVGSAFRASDLPAGVAVRRALPAVGAVVVTAPPGSADDLGRVAGVRGVATDHGLRVVNRDVTDSGAVAAPAAVGGAAGSAGAGAGVTVALVDTGVADTAALSRGTGRLVAGADTSGERTTRRDGHGHGTFMAGLIAGGRVGSVQVGVAPAATVVDVKVAEADGTTSLSRVLAGFDWVIENRGRHSIDVMSLSLAADRPTEEYGRDPLTDGVEAVKEAGIAVLVATGNKAGEVGDPGQDPYIMAVGAADTRQSPATTAPFSGSADVFGMPRPDFVAPGVSVLSVLPPDSVIARDHPQARVGGALYKGSGTSQATAVAAGAVAVFLGQQGAVSPDHVRSSFGWFATDLAGDADGAGLISIPTRVERQPGPQGQGGEATGSKDPEPAASSWSASSWSASSWSKATSWSASSWSKATSWSASSWSATSWSKATSWSATSWSRATSWSATSWSAGSW